MSAKVIVLGLDGVPPELLFSEPIIARMPIMAALRRRGRSGALRSVTPPITVPAWACAMTGNDPGQLGLYGIRNRRSSDYGFSLARSTDVTADAVWDVLGRDGRRSTVIGLPPGYPAKSIHGEWVSCMLTPDDATDTTWPPALRAEITDVVGRYVFDVEGFRRVDRAALLSRIWDMTARRWELARHLLKSRESDLFILHEIGSDRMHHGFWADHDIQHPRHDPNGVFRTGILDYYEKLDVEIGRLLELAPEAQVLVLSDHGCKTMVGGIRANQWLIDNGYLVMTSLSKEPRPFSSAEVNWSRTRAWAAGGYYGRVWLNLSDREANGIVSSTASSALLDEIEQGLRSIGDPSGQSIDTQVYRPRNIYREVRGVAPDLLVYFGGLDWRSVATVGGSGWHTFENDTGPDDANHSVDGVFVVTTSTERIPADPSLLDISSLLLAMLDVPAPGIR